MSIPGGLMSLCMDGKVPASTGWTFVGNATSIANGGSVPWWSIGASDLSAADATYAQGDYINPTLIDYAIVGNTLGFSVPAGALITGVEVRSRTREKDIGESNLILVKLVKGGTIVGDNAISTPVPLVAAETLYTYGSSSDLWGITLTPADVNASTFGFAQQHQGASATNAWVEVNSFEVNVHYLD